MVRGFDSAVFRFMVYSKLRGCGVLWMVWFVLVVVMGVDLGSEGS